MHFWERMQSGCRRYFKVWHRRSGKDITDAAYTAVSSLQRVGLYWHVYPTYESGRKAFWNGFTSDGRRFRDVMPPALVVRERDDFMLREFTNGSMHQVVGTDDPDRLRGANPVGVVMSEFAYQQPEAWDIIRPILAENGGWAIFNTTPRGRNHAYDLYQYARRSEEWGASLLTVNDTFRPDGTRVVSEKMIADERASGMSEAMIAQEYFCSWDSPYIGAIYGDVLRKMRETGAIGEFPWVRDQPVWTWWDIGINDPCCIWFAQQLGKETRIIDFMSEADVPLEEWIRRIKNQPYTYAGHVGPWDLEHREQLLGKTKTAHMAQMGLHMQICPRHSVGDGINEVRRFLLRSARIDGRACEAGLDKLGTYRWKTNKGQTTETPEHEGSDAADALRTGVMMNDRTGFLQDRVYRPEIADSAYNLWTNRPARRDHVNLPDRTDDREWGMFR